MGFIVSKNLLLALGAGLLVLGFRVLLQTDLLLLCLGTFFLFIKHDGAVFFNVVREIVGLELELLFWRGQRFVRLELILLIRVEFLLLLRMVALEALKSHVR